MIIFDRVSEKRDKSSVRTFIRIVGGLNQAACSLVGKSSMWYKERVGVAIKISPAKPKSHYSTHSAS